MSEVDKIKSEIEALPDHDYVELRRWFQSEIGKSGIDRLKKTLNPENSIF